MTKLVRNSRVFTQLPDACLPDLAVAVKAWGKGHFWGFRRYIHPMMKVGWWQQEVADEFQLFYRSLMNGEQPKLVLMAPPGHGRTEQVMDFVAFLAGREPDLKVIFASHSRRVGLEVNLALQRIMTSEPYLSIFGSRLIDVANGASPGLRNCRKLDYVNHDGSFYNTIIRGQITGLRLDVGILGDLKGRTQPDSKAVRDRIWTWFTNDFCTRFSARAGVVIITTRWHADDPVGRFIARNPDVRILRYPAIAEHDETQRLKGEALFPQHKSLSFLMERRKLMTQSEWECEYQQRPSWL